MKCIKCGYELKDDAKFCSKCGQKQQIIDGTNEVPTYVKVKNSTDFIKNLDGYYCFNCGNYINRKSRDYVTQCSVCHSPIIAPQTVGKALDSVYRYGFLGAALAGGISAINSANAESSNDGLSLYYSSDYYKATQLPAENVVSDKGRIGEYLVSRQIKILKEKLDGRSLYAFYNVIIPEPNGSYQEIDALLIYGRHIFVIEAKNREGRFIFKNWTDEVWTQEIGNARNQVYNPFLQNQEHIAALRNYLSDVAKDCNLYNVLSFSNLGIWDTSVPFDTYDTIVLGLGGLVCNVGVLNEYLYEAITNIEKRECDSSEKFQVELKEGSFSAASAKDIIDKLQRQLKLTENEKSILFRDRNEKSEKHHKQRYRYYYVEKTDLEVFLVRTNGVYIELLPNKDGRWIANIDNDIYFDDSNFPQSKTLNLSYAVYLEYTKDICEQFSTIIRGECYIWPDDTYIHYYSEPDRKKYEENRQRNKINESAIFFKGCENVEMLHSRYRNLCKTFHPDGQSGDETTFKQMQDEYNAMLRLFDE